MPTQGLSFNTKVTGIPETLARLVEIRTVVRSAFRDPRLRKYLVQITKDRFAPAGSNPRAQKTPEGVKWAAPAPSTPSRRKVNRNGYTQALVDTSKLRRSITVIESRLSDLAMDTGRAGIRVGVPTTSPAYGYGGVQNYGGVTAKGRPIPARSFLGLDAAGQKYINRLLQSVLDARLRG